MKNLISVLTLLLVTIQAYTQSGVGTANPQATLDVVGLPTDASKPDGLIPPRITRLQLKAKTAYSAPQTGAIVYVTEVDSSASTPPIVEVTRKGYYYFDGTKWVGLLEAAPSLKFFYMPSVPINTSTLGTALGINLYQLYKDQFQSPKVISTGAPASIPYFPAATDLYYYVTNFDQSALGNISIDANGLMTYDVIAPATDCSYVNVVFVQK